MITCIYPRTFQKSHVFLYPLICFRKDIPLHPNNTYLFADIDLPRHSLICVYKQPDSLLWNDLENKFKLFSNHYISYFVKDNNIIAIFDLKEYEDDYEIFLQSKYSKLSLSRKKIIMNYYGGNDNEYINSYLYPEKYFGVYSNILNIDENILRNVGELCSKIDFKKETWQL